MKNWHIWIVILKKSQYREEIQMKNCIFSDFSNFLDRLFCVFWRFRTFFRVYRYFLQKKKKNFFLENFPYLIPPPPFKGTLRTAGDMTHGLKCHIQSTLD